jgi:putative cardiolipin synthase
MNSQAGWTLAITALLIGCSTQPPGSDFPRSVSVAFALPEATDLGQKTAGAASEHAGVSGYRLLSAGVDGFLVRAQMIDAAQRSLDRQYFILRGDETGRLLADAALRAADRGVRIRLLIDDGETIAGDERIAALSAHPKIEVPRLQSVRLQRQRHRLARARVHVQFVATRLPHAQQAVRRR